ncbi:MAG: tetratricopeptide repeat protein [Planctomycetota bacterium]|nr:tetratricopeptide repeat protein [Planctomycetota bacterium]
MESANQAQNSELPAQLRLPVKVCESEFQQLFQSAPLLSLHARFAFETLGKIGEGGMGSVYQVKDHRINRIAALKLLSDKNATEHARLRFFREAVITAGLDHPGIPPVYETGLTADGDLYMLMRMIRGRTLGEVVKECHDLGKLERRDLVEIMVKVTEALAYAHSQGIVHRDLKPDNIMVGEFGEVLVIDWGIAKDLNVIETEQTDKILECVLSKSDLDQAGVTVSGTMVGTPGYMAPEQIDGVDIDERSDVFALGLILVEVLTGKRAVSGDTTIDRVAATASGSALSPRDIDSSLSKEIDWIAREAMEIEAELRTQSAEDFVSQLRAYLNGEEIPGYSYSLIERIQRTIKRRPGAIVASALGALLLALIGNLWLTLELEGQKRQEAEKNVDVATKKLGVAEDDAEKAKAVLALFNEARNLVERGAPEAKLKEKINEALERGGRTEDQLLTAARIYSEANIDRPSKELLEEAVRVYPPCYAGLFSLHLCELRSSNREFYFTSYLRRLVAESKKRKEENEYTLFADACQIGLSGRLDESIEVYSKIEEYSMTFAFMNFNRGLAWKKKGDFDKAFADYNRAIEINPRFVAAYTNRGFLWKERGELDKALADYNRAIEINPRFAAAFGNRGVIWKERGELGKALADYDRAIELNPREAAAFGNRGVIWKEKGELGKALADYNRAIEIDPRLAAAYTNRGHLWRETGELGKALADYNRAIEIDPRLVAALSSRGHFWKKRGDLDKALADYNRVIEIDPRDSIAFTNRGLLWREKGDFDKALADYNKAIELNPRDAAAFGSRGLLWKKIGDFDKALKDLNRVIGINPREAGGLANRALIWEKKGEFEKALADYKRSIGINPREAAVYSNRGLLWQKIGDFDKALADFNRALELNPQNSEAFFNRAILLMKNGRRAEALADVGKAMELKHKDPYIYFIRGYLNTLLKRPKAACVDLETFLRLAPNHSQAGDARKLLVRARAEQGK